MTSFLTEVFRTVLNMSVTAAAVIAVLGLVRLPLKRAPKVITYGLWFVALFRLLCPVSFESAVSLFSLRRAPTMEFITNTADFPGIHPGQAALTPGSGAPVVPGPGAAPAAAGASDAGAALTLLNVLAFVWAAVAAGLIIYGIVSYILLKRRIGTATCAGGRVFESDRIAAPFVCGMLRPRIFLPVSLRESERAYITEHEKTHIRRRDYVIKPLWFLAVCLHWFNPLVWLAFLLMGRDMEMSCDEAVLRKMGEGVKADYSSSLLAFSSPRALFSASPLAFGESNILSRVKNVLSFKRPVVWVVIVAVAAAVTLTVALAANPKTAAAAAPADPVKTSAAPPTEVSAVSSADSGQAVSVDYVLYKLGKDGVVLTYISPLDENQKTTVENTLRKLYLASTYVPAVDPDSLDECYLIRVIPQGQTASNYYVFMNGGRACLQFGKNGQCSALDDSTYESLKGLVDAELDKASANVEKNLEIIMSSPKTSSDPHDYIEAHRAEYEDILKLGHPALNYMLSLFYNGEGDTLKGYIMMLLCNDIMGVENKYNALFVSPSEWYAGLDRKPEDVLPDFVYSGTDPVTKLVYETETSKYRGWDGGFTVVAVHEFGRYEEGDKLKVIVTTFAQNYHLYGVYLEAYSGSVVPAAMTFTKNADGTYTLSDYTQAQDGSLFAPSIRDFCTMPVSGDTIPGLSDMLLKHYGNYNDIIELQKKNLEELLKQNGVTEYTLKN